MEITKSYKELVQDYFKLADYKIEENAPKLTKQLKKACIDFTVEEIQSFQELLLAVFDNNKDIAYTFEFSKVLPDYEEQNSWAFDGSCNREGGVGEFTSEILNTIEESRYCYIYDEDEDPTARFYYLEKDGVFALADLYSDNGHGFYLAPQIILCSAFNIKLEQFELFEGQLVKWHNSQGFWSNLATSSYKHFVSGEFEPVVLDIKKVDEVYNNNNCTYSEYLDRYITNTELEDGDYIYCGNIDDYDDSDNTFYCEGCNEYHSLSGDTVETDYNTFCSIECACDCGYVLTEEGDLVDIDETFSCEDCCGTYLLEDCEAGSDGCYYCSDCIHEHLEDEEEIA